MYELEDERPIPLGRAATPAAASVAHAEAPSVVEPAVEAQPVMPVPGVEIGPPPAVAAAPEVVPPMAPVMPVPAVNLKAQPADPPGQPDGHPLAGLRAFRLEPILVEPPFDWGHPDRVLRLGRVAKPRSLAAGHDRGPVGLEVQAGA